MAGPIFLDRAGQVTTSSGVLTTITLGDVIEGNGGFKPIYQVGKIAFGDWSYFIVRHVDPRLNEWQVFEGTLTNATTITVGTIGSSSNDDNSAVSFSAGNKYIILDASAAFLMGITAASGTVTSVGLASDSDIYTVADSPITTSGNLTFNKTPALAANRVYATPNGVAGVIGLRALVAPDIPDLSATYSTPASTSSQISSALVPYSTTAQINTALAGYVTLSGVEAVSNKAITLSMLNSTVIGGTTPAAITGTTIAGTTGTFSDLVTLTRNALGTTPTNGLSLINTTAAAAGAQQISPATHWRGQGWKTTATAASQAVEWQAYVLPVEGTTAPTSQWLLRSSINGGAYSTIMTVDSQGRVGIGTTSPLAPLNVFSSGSTAPVRIQQNSAANGDVLLNLVGGAMTGTHLVVNASANATVETIFRNQNNSTTSGAHATMQALVAGAGNTTGDAKMLFGNSSGRTIGIGYDQSADAFVIADGGTLGTNNRLVIGATGNVGVGAITPSALLDVNTDIIRQRTAKTPSSASDTGNAGDFCWDTNYEYRCVSANSWKRVAISAW